MNNCLLYAVSQLTGIGYDNCQSLIGHDGEELINDNRRGYHIQEVITKVLLPRGYLLTPLEVLPASRWPGGILQVVILDKVYGQYEQIPEAVIEDRMRTLLDLAPCAIVEGMTARGVGHAYAKVLDTYYDQRGQYTWNDIVAKEFICHCIWRLDRNG
jgi:hypothetical protein